MEQERLQWKQNFSLSSNDASSNQQAEQPCTYQTMPDEEQIEEGNQSLPDSTAIQSDRVNQQDERAAASQSQEFLKIKVPLDQQKQNVVVKTSSSSFWKDYFQPPLYARYQSHFDPILLSARVLSLILILSAVVLDALVFCNVRSDSKALKFMYGITFVFYEVAAMLFGSGTAPYGATMDTLMFPALMIVNCVLAHYVWDCDSDLRKKASILFTVRTVFLIVGAELAHQNFRKLDGYSDAVLSAGRYVLRQILFFTLTILVLVAPGLKTVHQSIYFPSPGCCYKVTCGFVELYSPEFNASGPCENGFATYISTREELRILRNLVYFHIAFYAMFNDVFLTASFERTYEGFLRFLTLIGFLFLAISYMWSTINPFGFVKMAKFYIFDILEAVLVLLLLIMLFITCALNNGRNSDSVAEKRGSMCKKPNILFHSF